VVSRMALEILLFRSLFRNDRAELGSSGKLAYSGNKFLWLGGLVFHWSLLIIILRHLRFFVEPIPGFINFLQAIDGMFQLGMPALYITDVLILIALGYLFLRRVLSPQIRYISLAPDYFALLLILGIAVTGVLMRHFYKVDLIEVKRAALGLFSLKPVVPEGLSPAFYIHFFLVSILFAYFPFSKLMHMGGIFLSPTRNLKNDSRMQRHINPWNYPVKVHTYEEWEDEFRDAIKEVNLPLEKDK